VYQHFAQGTFKHCFEDVPMLATVDDDIVLFEQSMKASTHQPRGRKCGNRSAPGRARSTDLVGHACRFQDCGLQPLAGTT
jgi:hypothetical protein